MSAESRVVAEPRTAGGIARSALTVVLIVLSVVSLALAPVSIWGRDLILDTDGFVSTMAPLAASPPIQTAVANAVERQVDEHLDIRSYIAQVLPPEAVDRLEPLLKRATLSLVSTVTTALVRSPQFQQLWHYLSRLAHEEVASLLLTGATVRGVVRVESDNILLDLSQIVSIVKGRLVSAGVGVAARVPNFGASITIAHLQGFGKIRSAVRALNEIANFLPWLGLALAAGALVAARSRRRAGVAVALGLAGGMCVLAVGLMVAQPLFTAPLVTRGLTENAATVLFDTVVRDLRGAIRVILACTLVIAAAIWATHFMPDVHLPRTVWDRVLLPFQSPPARFVARYATPLRIGVVAVPLAIIILIDGPPLALVVTFACLVIVALGLIELCCRAPRIGVSRSVATPR